MCVLFSPSKCDALGLKRHVTAVFALHGAVPHDRDITQFIMDMLRDRKEDIPPQDLLDAARYPQ